jgi:hypothetical protein
MGFFSNIKNRVRRQASSPAPPARLTEQQLLLGLIQEI